MSTTLFEVRNAMIRAKIQEKLHGVRGVIEEVARRDLMSDRFKTDAGMMGKMLCAAIAELDKS